MESERLESELARFLEELAAQHNKFLREGKAKASETKDIETAIVERLAARLGFQAGHTRDGLGCFTEIAIGNERRKIQ